MADKTAKVTLNFLWRISGS